MGEHRRRKPPWWKTGREMARLRRAYAELEARYRALEEDNAVLIGDLEELRGLRPEPVPEPNEVHRSVPSWALTEPLGIPLAPEQAATLVMETGLLESPSGSLASAEGTTG